MKSYHVFAIAAVVSFSCATDHGPVETHDAVASEASTVGWSPCPTNGFDCRISYFGDSLTVGGASTDWGGFREWVRYYSLAAGKHVTHVGPSANGPDYVRGIAFPKNHSGASGFCSDTFAATATTQACSGILPLINGASGLGVYQADVVYFEAGGNDVARRNDTDHLADRLIAMVVTAANVSPNALIVLGTTSPFVNSASEAIIASQNARLPAMVAAQQAAGVHVVLADVHTAVVTYPNWQTVLMAPDGEHLTNMGHQREGIVIYESISAYLR